MQYQRFTADVVFTGEAVLTQHAVIANAQGTIIDVVPLEQAGSEVQHFKGWLCPGFVNAHCHLELSHMLGRIPEHTGMVDFLLQVMFNRQADAELIQYAMHNAAEQMLGHGIVAVGDICNTANSAAIKQHSSIYWHSLVEISGFVPAAALQRFEQGISVMQALQQHQPAAQLSVVPHAPYSVSGKLYELIAQQTQTVVSMHNQESVAEEMLLTQGNGDLLRLYEAIGVNIDFFTPKGNSSLQHVADWLPQQGNLLLVHNCHSTADDIALMQQRQQAVYWCFCPRANQYIGNPLPNVPLFIEKDARICLGTDSLASNHSLSILAEMQTLQAAFPQLQLAQLLQWATYNGAAALGIQQQYGQLKPGMKPGLLLLENVGANGDISHSSVQRLC